MIAIARSLLTRGRTIPRHYGTPKGWKGPVERRDPASYQRAPRDCGLLRCTNRWCALWLVSGTVRCPHCHVAQTPAS